MVCTTISTSTPAAAVSSGSSFHGPCSTHRLGLLSTAPGTPCHFPGMNITAPASRGIFSPRPPGPREDSVPRGRELIAGAELQWPTTWGAGVPGGQHPALSPPGQSTPTMPRTTPHRHRSFWGTNSSTLKVQAGLYDLPVRTTPDFKKQKQSTETHQERAQRLLPTARGAADPSTAPTTRSS